MIKELSVSIEDGKIKKKSRKIAQTVLRENAEQVDRMGQFPSENIEALAKEGLLKVGIKESQGGIEGTITTTNLVIEELAKECPSTAMSYLMHISTLPLITRVASYSQVERLIKPIVEGKHLISYSQSEKETGSRLWFMQSFAEKKEDHYVVDSFKSFATSSGFCDSYMLVTRQSETAAPNELSIFLVDANDESILPIGEWDAMGLRGTSSTPVHFNQVKIPEDRLLGMEKKGYNLILAYTLPSYILGLSAVYLGIAKRAYEAAKAHVLKRSYKGKGSGELRDVETIQRYLAEMRVEIDKNQAYLNYVTKLANEGTKFFDHLYESDLLEVLLENAKDPDFLVQLAQVKIACCELARKITDTALQVCGGSGYKRGTVVEQCYRDARAGSVMGPADDILKVIIGKSTVGLPLPWEESID